MSIIPSVPVLQKQAIQVIVHFAACCMLDAALVTLQSPNPREGDRVSVT